MKFPSVLSSGLAQTMFFKTVPGNLLLIPLDILTDLHFLCPCSYYWNTVMTVVVFMAPAFLVFALTLLFLLKSEEKEEMENDQGNNKERARGDGNAKEKRRKNALFSLFPVFVWIILLLIDGHYVACSQTKWEGQYTYNEKLKIKWCKPNELMLGENEAELQNQILLYIRYSQLAGHILIVFLSCIFLFLACFYHDDVKQRSKKISEEEKRLGPNC